MARSAIPGPLRDDNDPPPDASRSGWPYLAGAPFRHHRPGPAGLGAEPEPRWLQHIHPQASDLEELYMDDLRVYEGLAPHMYLCSAGKVTIGIGNMLPTVETAKRLPLVNTSTSQPASEAEIATAYAAVSQMPPNQWWTKYRLSPSLEITEAFAYELAIARLKKEFLPQIIKRFPDFDDYPKPAKRFMVDMAYNGGAGHFAKRGMVGAIKNRDWLACIPLVKVPPDPKRRARMYWRYQMLREAAAADAP